MNKDLIRKLLTSNMFETQDILTFIAEYTFHKLKRDISGDELFGIHRLIQEGVFNLNYALVQAALIEGLNVLRVFDKQGILIKTIVS